MYNPSREDAINATPTDETAPLLAHGSAATEKGKWQVDPFLLRRLRIRVFLLTWLGYFAFYLTRKPISVVKSTLEDDEGIDSSTLSWYDTGYLTTYAIGQFVNGALGDRIGSRWLVTGGLIGSAVCCGLFSLTTDVWYLGVLWTLNGYFQSCGWPGCVKGMTPWFTAAERGALMGWWSTCYQVGGVAGTVLSTLFLDLYGWESAFLFPSLFVLLSGIVIGSFMVNHPNDANLASPLELEIEEERLRAKALNEKDAAEEVHANIPVLRALMLPGVIEIGLSYFCLKLVRYALLFWLPYYLDEEVGYSSTTAGYVSAMFDVGGSLGSIFAGYASDRWAGGRRVIVAIPCFVMAAASMGLYLAVGETGVVMNGAVLGFVGVFIFGPDSLLAGAAAQDIGGRASSTVAGLINGIGSIGAILQGPVTDQMSDTYGWESLFYLLISLCGVCCVLLSRLLVRDIQLIREAMMVLPSSP
eukprot:TRINITY_DN6458_c0_g1_i2.p1 TRINITY_DN6458_c0_g1~~TRINITY_DN6458_c0_g1_i2.p1  ORF type:complete len:471 (-),score=94.31 TRINITY_DN6458_c0_g1_i2:317-1729(-)